MNRRNATVCTVVATAFLCLPAAAQPNSNQRAEAEARAMLPKCRHPDQPTQQLCLGNQRNFIREYVFAKAGSDINIRGVASYLTPLSHNASDFERSLHFGIPPNVQEACAWRFWHAMMPSEGEALTASLPVLAARIRDKRRSWQPTCLQLHFDAREASLARAERLMNEYLSAPARMPPSDWKPNVAGLVEPKRSPPIPDHCLTRESRPLQVPGTPEPPIPLPPKGCPGNP